MITHVIYHIQARKVGCTRDLTNRRLWYPTGTVLEVLEELHDRTDQEAGDIEWAWADKFGYKRGNHYTKVADGRSGLLKLSHEQRMEISKKAGKRTAELKTGGYQTLTLEQRVQYGFKGGKQTVDQRLGIHGLTHQQRTAINQKNGKRALELKAGFHSLTTQQRSEIASRKITCPHCHKIGGVAIMYRWHFDHCPKKKFIDKLNARVQGKA